MNPLTWLSGAKTYLVIGGFVVLGAAVGVQTVRLAGSETALATEKADRSNERADRHRVALTDALRVSEKEATYRAQQMEALHAFNTERKLWLAGDTARRDESRRLRSVIAAYAAGDRDQAESGGDTCRDQRDRSQRLGGLLGEAVDLADEGEGLVRQRDGEVVLLLGEVARLRALLGH
jgi:hypothetical protein